ncbi:MAG TPA: lipoprotein [Casimicrobiaceae bacterium]|nr:lipoprotein [Casimicrobiaceae bacterium]
MSRQSIRARALRAACVAALLATLAACGIKGPLRPPPKAATAPPASSTTNPATAPATTSPALPPPNGDRNP